MVGWNCKKSNASSYRGQVVSVTTSLTTFFSLISNTRTLPTLVPSSSYNMQHNAQSLRFSYNDSWATGKPSEM